MRDYIVVNDGNDHFESAYRLPDEIHLQHLQLKIVYDGTWKHLPEKALLKTYPLEEVMYMAHIALNAKRAEAEQRLKDMENNEKGIKQ